VDSKQYVLTLLLVGSPACAYETHPVGSGREWIAADGGIEDEEAEPTETSEAPEEEERDRGGERERGPRSYSPEHADPAVTAAIEAWRARHESAGDVPSPATRTCETRFEHLDIVTPSDDDFRRLCQRCNTTDASPHCSSLGRVNACAPFGDERDDDGHIGPLRGLIVLDPALATDSRARDHLVIHEAIHHLGYCTRFGEDATHASTALWAPDASSIEATAQTVLH
jgi:hypothetical protein